MNIINGYIRTPKIYQLNKLSDYLNNKGYDINKYPLDLTPLNSNAWLSGFIEAEGHFSVRVSTDSCLHCYHGNYCYCCDLANHSHGNHGNHCCFCFSNLLTYDHYHDNGCYYCYYYCKAPTSACFSRILG